MGFPWFSLMQPTHWEVLFWVPLSKILFHGATKIGKKITTSKVQSVPDQTERLCTKEEEEEEEVFKQMSRFSQHDLTDFLSDNLLKSSW